MQPKLRLYPSLPSLFLIFALLMSSCQAATEVAVPDAGQPIIQESPTQRPIAATPVTNRVSSQKPDTIQNLNDRQLLSSSGGAVVWENPYLTITEPTPGILSWLPLDVSTPNFVLHTQFTWNSTDTGETACGVSFHDDSQGSYYLALVRKNGDGLLWLSLANQWQASPAESYGNYVNSGNNEVNDLILIAEGPQITLLLNDAVLYQATDYSLDSGSINFINGTALDGNTCTFQDSWIWEIGGSEPVQQVSNPPEEEVHDIYAGFTDNYDIPFLAVHKSGEKLGVAQDNSVVWNSPTGEALVIFPNSNSLPKSAVVGQYVIHYSNYTNETVDITVISPNGSREIFRTKYSADLSNRIAAHFSPSYQPIKYLLPKAIHRRQQDIWDKIDNALFDIDVATCTFATLQAKLTNPALGDLVKTLNRACRGAFIELKIKEGEAQHMDVTGWEGLGVINDTVGCLQNEVMGCVQVIVTAMKTLRVEAVYAEDNVQPIQEPPKCNSKYNCN